MFKSLLLIASFSVLEIQAIGLQHALFRSQSTQGPAWTGTVNIQKEEFTITVYPDYLDVQLDWELGVGGTAPESFRNALEIVGNINFEANSTVVGMLLWNGDRILKAKLKTKDQARKEYETVVDRSSAAPQPPRDPVILEWVRQDNYDLSVFPVSFGGFRKMRIRYLVPSTTGSFGFPHAFSNHAKVTFVKGPAITGFKLSRFNSKDTVSFSQGEVTLSPSDFGFQPYSYSTTPPIERVIPIMNDTSPGSRLYIGSFFGNGFSGQAVHAVYHLPIGLLGGSQESKESDPRIFATLFSGQDSCRKEVSRQEGTDNIREELKILSRGSLEESLKWSVFIGDSLQKEVMEKPGIIRMEDGIQYARTFGNSRIYPIAKTMPFSLGSALGFIDTKYALVALEEDLLTAISADKYRLTGVPTLNPEDIFPSKEDTAVTTNEWSASKDYDPNLLLKPAIPYQMTSLVSLKGLPEGIRFALRDGSILIHLDPAILDKEKKIKVSIYTAMGRLAKQWSTSEISQGTLSWSPSESGLSGGAFLLRVETGAKKYLQPFFLR
jgi:hypothetical protein